MFLLSGWSGGSELSTALWDTHGANSRPKQCFKPAKGTWGQLMVRGSGVVPLALGPVGFEAKQVSPLSPHVHREGGPAPHRAVPLPSDPFLTLSGHPAWSHTVPQERWLSPCHYLPAIARGTRDGARPLAAG